MLFVIRLGSGQFLIIRILRLNSLLIHLVAAMRVNFREMLRALDNSIGLRVVA